MLQGIINAIASFERETGTKPAGLVLTKHQFDCLLSELVSKCVKFESGSDPYCGIVLYGTRIE